MWGVLVDTLHICASAYICLACVPCGGSVRVPSWVFVAVLLYTVSIGLGVSCSMIDVLCPVVARWSVSSCLFIIIHIDIVGNGLIAFLLYIGYSDQKKKALHRVRV